MRTEPEELEILTRGLEGSALFDVLNFARAKFYAQTHRVTSPTAAQWNRIPEWLRWSIFLRLVWGVWQMNFAAWMWRLTLFVGGQK